VNEKRLRVGVIGVGHLGEYHVQKYKAMPHVNLVGVVDTDWRRAQEIALRYGTRPFQRYEDILPLVEAVSLAVPTEQHFQVAKGILTHGLHLLVEKPITYELAPADTLIRIAEEKGLVLQVGWWSGLIRRWSGWKHCSLDLCSSNPHRMNVFTPRERMLMSFST
jgi:predicted dehydrogenase